MGRYRVDTIPRYLVPFYQAYGKVGATALSSYGRLTALTCDWDVQTPNNTETLFTDPCIHCTWHENVPTYFSYYFHKNPLRKNHVWLQHPAAYMLPIHNYLDMNKVEYVLGSSGHDGQEAMELLIAKLQESSSSSTAFFPDGPAGPVHQVKPGVAQVAKATGLPIIPIRFHFESFTIRNGWDRKHFPLPYSTVRIQELDPIVASKEDDAQVLAKMIEDSLNS